MPDTKQATKVAAVDRTTSEVWTDDERAAMQEHAREMKTAKARKGRDDGERDLLAKIAEMPDADRRMAERIHEIVKENAPHLTPRTWYGMPAWARDGKLVCFFQAAAKFKARYATFGFEQGANLDEGSMWPTAYALTDLSTEDEARIGELVRKAAG
jgi:uncharacterized protein YdhG (YjbR/CyaY superfamily)